MSNQINISKKSNSTMLIFEINHHHVAQIHCTGSLNRITKQPCLSNWVVEIQAESFSIEDPEVLNQYQKRITFINQYCSQLKQKYQDDADGFIDLEVKATETF